ncbi:helix-turn-helix domain-containing protein [Nocardia sp. NPDC004068]|uniref:helix-turn-helix domain-containing protein n=1 Tax=Nocardia sp. NPDC004068 TaxID=3364303 RepID=UPI0036753DCE
MSATGDIIRKRRAAKKLSQTALAELIGEDQKTVSRYETGESEPSLSAAIRLADALDLSIRELAGLSPRGLDLSGEWWASWQTWGETGERVDTHEMHVVQDGSFLQLDGARARPVTEGSYAWVGEMKLWDNEGLMGWYVAQDGGVRSKGALYFALHPHGQMMAGSWVGQSYAGLIVRGWGAIARERSASEELCHSLMRTEGNLSAWPNLHS